MLNMDKRQEFLKLIEENIRKNNFHITFVVESQNPHFAYTIGLFEKFGFELVIAGGFVSKAQNEKKFNTIFSGLNKGLNVDAVFTDEDGGVFELVEVHSTWKERMTLGVFDYYKNDKVKVFQVLSEDRLIDTPIMSNKWNENDKIWCWLDKDWTEDVPLSSHVVTNIDFLKGGTITDVMRWEDEYWEMFVGEGSDVPDENVRILPIGTMLGIDESLRPAIELSIGKGLWRENKESEWSLWE